MSGGRSPRKMMKCSESDGNSGFDAATRKPLKEIAVCQKEINRIHVEASEEILKVEQRFNKLRKPIFDKRNLIISNIPNFWMTAILNHPTLSILLDANEVDCLSHLTKLEVEDYEDVKSGYYIKFHFEENPFLENTVITKEYHLGCEKYSYFRFPKDEARCNEWKLTLEIVKLDSITAEQCYKRFRVCSAHFENRMYSSIQKNKLKRNAVPTIFVNAQHSTREDEAASGISGICMQTSSGWESVPSTSFDGPNSKSAPGTSITEYNPEGVSGICMQTSSGRESVPSTSFDQSNSKSAPRTSIAEYNPEEVSTQTPTSLSKNTPRKVHLRNKIRVLQRKSKEQNTPSKGQISREEVVEYVRQNSSPALASFLETQLKLSGKSPKGLRYSNEYKQFA
ncbi:hypothetical protein JTB14_034049 [Gonioctena quinquepunctata]|nr:hypothetical protein JTB14_034049 [Gonioctena quinquepunctata]